MSILSKKSFLSSHSPLKYRQNDSWLRPFEAIELILRKNRIKKNSEDKKNKVAYFHNYYIRIFFILSLLLKIKIKMHINSSLIESSE